jgi:hypothetical protein
MSKSPGKIRFGTAGSADSWWCLRRETSLNWLALGLLLAAWNASEDDQATPMSRRPPALHGYHFVSVRAAQRARQ